MSDDELEARLKVRPLDAPHPGLRADVLKAVRAELAATGPAVPTVDRWLARPLPWVAAATLLAGLLVGQALLDRSYERPVDGSSDSTLRPAVAAEDAPAFARNRALVLSLIAGKSDDV